MNSGKINNFFCKLRNFGSCFFLAFFLNFNSVKASQIPNTSEIQKVIELIKSKDDNQLKKLITIVKSNGKTLVVLEFEELQEEKSTIQKKFTKLEVGKKIGGTLTGHTYESYMRKTSSWLENYEKENRLKELKGKPVKITKFTFEKETEEIKIEDIKLK